MADELLAIHPGSDAWAAWRKHHAGTKLGAQMDGALAAATRRRAQWLKTLLVELLSSDIPTADIKIAETPEYVSVALRGVPQHRLDLQATWYVPTLMPPALSPDHVSPKRKAAEADKFAEHVTPSEEAVAAAMGRLEAQEARQKIEADAERDRRCAEMKTQTRLDQALIAAQHNIRPDVGGADDFDLIEIVDPMESVDLKYIGRGAPMITRRAVEKQTRVISLRDDMIGRMHKRGDLGDDRERGLRLRAARFYEALYERSEIGGARGLDPMKDIVDGGQFVMPDSDARLISQRRLAEIDKVLLQEGVALVRAVLVRKIEIAQYAEESGFYRRNDVRMFRRKFLERLDQIVKLAGLEPKKARTPRDGYRALADLSDNPALYTAIHWASRIK